jgi:predicted transcriptional regulator
MQRGIPDDVVAFLAQSIDSVEQLEVLLLLHQNASTEWTAESVARHLYREPTSVGRRLSVLRLLGLLQASDDPQPTFRYAPRSDAIHATVGRLADAYAQRRVTVLGLLASKPMDHVRAFADAFRIRREED